MVFLLDTGQKLPLVFGDNELAVQLVPVVAKPGGEVSVEELECYLYLTKQSMLLTKLNGGVRRDT